MQPQRFATFVHISDLHFGEMDENDDSKIEAAVPWWWRLLPIFKGYLGHHGAALRQLEAAVGELREDEDATILLTGDLTANGGGAQLMSRCI